MLSTERPADRVAGASARSAGSAAEVVALDRGPGAGPAGAAPTAVDGAAADGAGRASRTSKAAGTARLLPAGAVRRLRGGYAQRRARPWPPWAGAAARAPGAWSSIVTHNFMLSQWPDHGTARHLGRGAGLPGQRHLHFRGRPRASRRGRLRAVGPLAAGQRRQYQPTGACSPPVTEEGGRRRSTATSPCRASEIEIVDTWQSVGLKGSASNDVVVSEVFVPEHRTLVAQAPQGRAHAGQRA